MKRRAAIAAASAVTLAVLGGGIAVAAGTGLFGNPRDPGAGRLAPVLDPASVSAPLGEASTGLGTTGQTLTPAAIEAPAAPTAPRPARAVPGEDSGHSDRTARPAQQAPAPTAGQTLGRGDGRPDDDSSDVTGRDDDHGGAAKEDDGAADHEFEGHDDDD
jgi:hypothetical protein